MKITFLGHASFRIEIADQTLLIDPWLTGNPVLPEDQHQAAVTGATHILLTHAHFDHMADVVRLSKELNVPLVGQYDLMGWLEESEGLSIVGFNKGAQSPLATLLSRWSTPFIPQPPARKTACRQWAANVVL